MTATHSVAPELTFGWRFGFAHDDGYLWPPLHMREPFMPEMAAKCVPFFTGDADDSWHPAEPAPQPDCGCGIYACAEIPDLAECFPAGFFSLPRAALYGVCLSGRILNSPSDPPGTVRGERATVVGPIAVRSTTVIDAVQRVYRVEVQEWPR